MRSLFRAESVLRRKTNRWIKQSVVGFVKETVFAALFADFGWRLSGGRVENMASQGVIVRQVLARKLCLFNAEQSAV